MRYRDKVQVPDLDVCGLRKELEGWRVLRGLNVHDSYSGMDLRCRFKV